MAKYNIIKNTLETKDKNKVYQGCTVNESMDQYPEVVASIDSLDEAKEALAKYASHATKRGEFWNVEEYYISDCDPNCDDDDECVYNIYEFAQWAKWYAVCVDLDDHDWGTGSHDLAEAKAMAKDYRAKGYDDAYIAVIDEIGNVCLDEIYDF